MSTDPLEYSSMDRKDEVKLANDTDDQFITQITPGRFWARRKTKPANTQLKMDWLFNRTGLRLFPASLQITGRIIHSCQGNGKEGGQPVLVTTATPDTDQLAE